MRYIRVETFDSKTEKSLGGYMCAAHSLLARLLYTTPTQDAEELDRLIGESDDPRVAELLSAMMALADIPFPDIYSNDKENHICLYLPSEFDECYEDLTYISSLLCNETGGRKVLIWKEFDLNEDEILYEDMYQIVISKDTYEKHNKDVEYDVLFSWE